MLYDLTQPAGTSGRKLRGLKWTTKQRKMAHDLFPIAACSSLGKVRLAAVGLYFNGSSALGETAEGGMRRGWEAAMN